MAVEQAIKYPAPAPYRGLDVSRPENQISPLFSPDENNVETVNGVLQKRRGYTQLLAGFPNSNPVLEGMIFGDASGTLHQVFVDTVKFTEYVLGTPDTWVDRTSTLDLTGDGSDPIFMANVGALSTDALFITNGKDAIKKWTGAGNWANLSLTGYTSLISKCIAGFKGHLVHGDVTEDGTRHTYRIVWSNQGDPEDYSGVSSGFLNLIEDAENTRVMCMHPLKLALIAYKNKSIYNLEYRGGRNGVYFAADQVIADSGAISPKSATPIPDLDMHFVITLDNVQLFDGFNFVRPAIGDRIKKDLFANLNWAEREKIFVKAFPEFYTVMFIYPSGVATVPDKGYMWNWLEDAWHPFTLANAGYSLIYSDVFFDERKALYGINGNVMNLFDGNSDNGTAINGYWRSKLFDFSDLDIQLRDKRKTSQRQEIDHSGTLPTVEVGVTNSILDSPTFAAASPVTAASPQTLADDPDGLPRTTIKTSGRYHTLKVSDNSSNAAFKTASFILHNSLKAGR